MSKNITASVGPMFGGRNIPQDVNVVQGLLNKVPVGFGGPLNPLVIDGICGARTTAAIKTFQQRHFGPSGADGRVDPGKRTIKKLNEFCSPAVIPSPFPPLTPSNIMLCPHGALIQVLTTDVVSLKATDTFAVLGCPFRVAGRFSPCLFVRWSGPSNPLDRRSIGTCLNAQLVSQGLVTVGL